LIKRLTVPFKGYWALPGGRMEPGETAEQTMMREVREETGLRVETVCMIGEYDERGVQAGLEYDYYATCFLVRPIGKEIRIQESEVAKAKMFKISDIPEKMAFEHSRMIKDFIIFKKSGLSKTMF
jgi:8-oxo-dGTP diphosphatase